MSAASRAVLEDCLYLNWALPRSLLPEPPEPLRYDIREWQGGEVVFASGLLFRHRRLRFRLLPLARISYPQFQLQLCTIDQDGTPSVLIRSILLPVWVAPGARWIADQPARTADFAYPGPGSSVSGPRRWEVWRTSALVVEAEPGSPQIGDGPVLGPWERTVKYMCCRPVAYAIGARGLHHLSFEGGADNVMPMKARIAKEELLNRCLGIDSELPWPQLHSAWLCPPMTASLVAARTPVRTVGTRIPAPG